MQLILTLDNQALFPEPITIKLWPDLAPIAIHRLREVVAMNKFDGIRMERLEPGFVIQPLFFDGKDPEVDVMVEPEFKTNPQNHALRFKRGTVAMAGDAGHASGCQFFISLSDTERLNGNFTVIGEVVDGFTSVDTLDQTEVRTCLDEASGFTYHCPKDDVIIRSVRIE